MLNYKLHLTDLLANVSFYDIFPCENDMEIKSIVY